MARTHRPARQDTVAVHSAPLALALLHVGQCGSIHSHLLYPVWPMKGAGQLSSFPCFLSRLVEKYLFTLSERKCSFTVVIIVFCLRWACLTDFRARSHTVDSLAWSSIPYSFRLTIVRVFFGLREGMGVTDRSHIVDRRGIHALMPVGLPGRRRGRRAPGHPTQLRPW